MKYTKKDIQNIYALTPMQEGMLFHAMTEEKNSAYAVQQTIYLQGHIDLALFKESIQEIIQRHEVFRTTIVSKGLQKNFQVVLKTREADFKTEDITAFPEEQHKIFLEKLNREDRSRGFDLTKDMLIRFMLIKTAENKYALTITNHHIIMDGWCTGILFNDLLTIYGAKRQGLQPKLPPVYPYSSYIKWLAKQDKNEARDFWKNNLLGFDSKTEVPFRNTSAPAGEYQVGEKTLSFSKEISEKIAALAGTWGTTLNSILQGVWALLLQRYNNTGDIVFGNVISGRPSGIPGVESIIGLFINTIPFRVKSKPELSFKEWIKNITLDFRKCEDYGHFPLFETMGLTEVGRDLITSLFVFENFPVDESIRNSNPSEALGFSVTGIEGVEETNYDLNLICEYGDTLNIHLGYNTYVFTEKALEKIMGHIRTVVHTIVENSAVTLKEIGILTEDEKNQILVDFNNRAKPYHDDITIIERFQEQVTLYPDKTALDFKDTKLSYSELNNKANALGAILREKGVGPEKTAAIVMESSIEMITAIFGVLKAGGIYLPIDPDYPSDRTSFMLEDSDCTAVLTNNLDNPKITENPAYKDKIVDLASLDLPADKKSDNLEILTKPDNAAYIIYTSGSTGRPKGVVIEHKNVITMSETLNEDFLMNGESRFLQFASPSFDASVAEIFTPLLSGCGLVIFQGGKNYSQDVLKETITSKGVTHTIITPAVLNILEPQGLNSLEAVITGGDVIQPETVEKWSNHCRLIDIYGPTENTVVSTLHQDLKKEIYANIGFPITNTTAYIMDGSLNLLPVGVPGELCLGGEQLAREYLNRPELTAEKFIKAPILGGERIYRSGDLAMWNADGTIEFLGRIDHQVKIRGFRIETGEIEQAISTIPGVIEKTVVLKTSSEGDKYLAAYYSSESEIPLDKIKEKLAETLPEYMIPQYIIHLPEIPLNPNGKIDRKALPNPEENFSVSGEYSPPETETEKKIAAIWQEILGMEKIGIDTSFFDLGGHSLKAMHLINRLRKELEFELTLSKLFEYSTIRQVAGLTEKGKTSALPRVEKAPEAEYYPVSDTQKRLYILNNTISGTQGSIAYNIPLAIEIRGELDFSALEKAINTLIRRHETFRTSFTWLNGELVQTIAPSAELTAGLSIEQINLDSASLDEKIAGFYKPFDLHKAPLLRTGIIKQNADTHYLLIDMHHSISDGVSQDILSREFIALYNGIELPDLPLQYKDFSIWQNRLFETPILEKSEKYWLGQFQGEIPLLELPLDFPRDVNRTFQGDLYNFTISKEHTRALTNLAAQNGTTPASCLYGLYALFLSKYTAQNKVVLGVTVAGRPHKDLENIIGAFINFLPVPITCSENQTFTSFVKETNKLLMQSYDNQIYPFDRLVENLKDKLIPGRNPLFDTMILFHNQIDEQAAQRESEVSFSRYPVNLNTSTLDLKLDCHINQAGELHCQFEYNTALFKNETIKEFGTNLANLIEKAAANPEAELKEYTLFTQAEQDILENKRKNNNLSKGEKLVISSTFTADSMENHISWWCDTLDIPLDIEFAPYNQVFQQLLDPASSISKNKDINLLLVRFEDMVRDFTGSIEEKKIKLENYLQELTAIVTTKTGEAKYFIGILPVTESTQIGAELSRCLQEIQTRWTTSLAAMDHISIIDFTNLAKQYSITKVFDPVTDKAGHIPFTRPFFAAMGTAAARKIYSWKKNPFKVVVLDCDNTLWQGICGEDGTMGVQVDTPYRELQNLMVNKTDEGMLLALCSKNNEQDVWEVFEKNPGMVLTKEHIAAHKINWLPKYENIKSLAHELNLGLDSFIFIDDNPMECSGMMENCPEVLTLQLPENSKAIPQFLSHVWALDTEKVTEEDKNRTAMYKAEQQRKTELETADLSLTDFLAGLELKMSMAPAAEHQFDRISQLTQRTNQFNMSTRRRTEKEIAQLAAEEKNTLWAIDVRDKFGDYGLVGAVITKKKKTKLEIDTLLLSCRVLGRNIEHAILEGLGRYCKDKGITAIEGIYKKTERNTPVFSFLTELTNSGWNRESIDSETTIFKTSLSENPASETSRFIEIYYNQTLPPLPKNTTAVPAATAGAAPTAGKAYNLTTAVDASEPITWNVALYNESALHHRQLLTALEHHSGEKLINIAVTKPAQNKLIRARYQEAETGTEIKITTIFRNLLNLGNETSLSTLDNFFDLGGNSLLAASLISRIFETTGVTLTLREIFLERTIKGLANLIDRREKGADQSIPKAKKQEHYQLTSQQKRLYLLQQFDTQATSYNSTLALRLKGALEESRFEKVFTKLVERHEALRTTFTQDENSQIHQQIHPSAVMEILKKKIDPKDIPREIANFIRSFDLTQAPLARAALLQIKPEEHILIIDTHHIIADGVSFAILIEDFGKLYNGQELPALEIQYKDYAAWQHSEFQTGTLKDQEDYWLKRFGDKLPVLNLPTDFSRPPVQRFEGSTLHIKIDPAVTGKLKELSQNQETTLYMVLLGAFKILLAKYSSQNDIIVGTGVAGRNRREIENVVGMFVNTLPLRSTLEETQSFTSYLSEIKEITLTALENQDYPFETLVEKLEIPRDISRNPLFDVMFMFQNMAVQAAQTGSLEIDPITIESAASRFDLTLVTYEEKGGITCSFEYSTNLFTEETMERMAGHFAALLKEITEAPEKQIQELSLLTKEERETLLFDFNKIKPVPTMFDKKTTIFNQNTITAQFENQAKTTPQAIAVEYGAATLTYGELNSKANTLAAILKKKNLGPEKTAALLMESSPEMIIAIMGVLKAGGAYLPIDPNYPEERISYMLEDSRSELVITNNLKNNNLSNYREETINLPDCDLTKNNNLENNNLSPKPENAAYIIYTSGSTGKPKGVVIEHKSVLNMAAGLSAGYDIKENTTLLQFASPSFDASAAEIFTTLLAGGKLVIFDRRGGYSEETLRQTIITKKITNMTLPPVVLSRLNPEGLDSLETVITAGDTITAETVENWSKHHRLVNGYGPTENTVCISINRNLKKEAPANIGTPIPKVKVYIVDKGLNLLPVGVPGEICVSGTSLARGYLNRPKLTAQKFVPNPFEPGNRMYRTGDLARWKADGTIEFMGRIDHQVKIRGYRIEIGEIETILSRVPGIIETVVIPRTDKTGEKYLAAYYTRETELPAGEIKKAMAEILPDYMVPQYIIYLPKMPVTPNGKIDKKGLPKPENSSAQSGYTAPRTEREKELAAIWQDILGLEKAGTTDSYFDLGGHSLNATTLVSRIRKDMGTTIEMADIFQNPTIEALAGVIDNSQKSETRIINPEDYRDTQKEAKTIPLLVKQAIFLKTHKNRLDPEWCNVGEMFQLSAPLDPELAEKALDLLCVHHEGLRSSFINTGGKWDHVIAPADNFKLFQVIDLSDCPVEKRKETVEKHTVEIQKKLTFSKAPLFKMTVFHFGDNLPQHLYLTISHIIMDTYSISIMIDDFIAIYTALAQGTAPALPAHTATLEDWAHELDHYAQSDELKQELPYWHSLPWQEIKPLPRDYEDSYMKNTIGSFRNITIEFTEDETRKLIAKTRKEYGTHYINALYMALSKTITRWTGGTHIEIASVLHGRDMVPKSTTDLSRTVSWFASNTVMVLGAPESSSPAQALAEIDTQVQAVPNKGYGYEILANLTNDEKIRRSMDGLFTGELIFNYAGEFSGPEESAADQVFKSITSNYDLIWINQDNPDLNMLFNLMAAIEQGKLKINWGYSNNVHKKETVERLAGEMKDYVLELL